MRQAQQPLLCSMTVLPLQIKALRNALHKDMTDLASMAQQQSARAADAEKRLVRSVGCGVQMLQRKERAKLLQSLFVAWR